MGARLDDVLRVLEVEIALVLEDMERRAQPETGAGTAVTASLQSSLSGGLNGEPLGAASDRDRDTVTSRSSSTGILHDLDLNDSGAADEPEAATGRTSSPTSGGAQAVSDSDSHADPAAGIATRGSSTGSGDGPSVERLRKCVGDLKVIRDVLLGRLQDDGHSFQ